ncbi:hypothetical protein [Plesiomonas sp. ZOR0011]|uniref:hypothetical protein n=1 Tax=Plesiomonas sp. ZOR0011 TaxID=1339230 RepID=UPI000647B2EE|nr:hypothetical protein [Plesiomonas sp. ZOR0011]
MIPLISAIAALAVQSGPALIRGISSMFGGSATADKVADVVEQVSNLGMSTSQQEAVIADRLSSIDDPAVLADLQRLKVELEKEQTRRQELQLQDNQAAHAEAQQTIREGDNAKDEYVRHTRPKMARQSWYMTALYVLLMSVLKAFGYGSGPDFDMAMMLISIAWAYLGLRTLDGFAPHPKASGQKVQSVVTGAVSQLVARIK